MPRIHSPTWRGNITATHSTSEVPASHAETMHSGGQPHLAAQRRHFLFDGQADHLQPRLAHGQNLPQQGTGTLGEGGRA